MRQYPRRRAASRRGDRSRRAAAGAASPRRARSTRGSSASTVPTPVRMAQARARHAWPSARAASPVIHWLAPSISAVRPSRLVATFSPHPRPPRVIRETKPTLSSRASRSISPNDTSTPAARSRAAPCAAAGFGSGIAATTRTTPAARIASTHGGVLPWWLHGSSVTYIVRRADRGPVRARRPARASRRALRRRARESPRRARQPSRTITQPTRGLGVAVNRPRSASASARAIDVRSRSVNSVIDRSA